jgi:hypothetical protein
MARTKLSRVEALAAGAIVGIGNALTGKGYDEMVAVLMAFENGHRLFGVLGCAETLPFPRPFFG